MILIDLIGLDAAQKLAATYGGRRLYISLNPEKLGWLRSVLGAEASDVVWQEFRGCYLAVAESRKRGGRKVGCDAVRRDRDIAIYELSGELPRSDLARIFGLQLREIHRIIKRVSQPATKAT